MMTELFRIIISDKEHSRLAVHVNKQKEQFNHQRLHSECDHCSVKFLGLELLHHTTHFSAATSTI